jgi:hypothetical protein
VVSRRRLPPWGKQRRFSAQCNPCSVRIASAPQNSVAHQDVIKPARHPGDQPSSGQSDTGVAMSKMGFPSNEFLINRAEQCRSMAAHTLVDPMVRDRMIDLALGYEKIARAVAKLKIENVDAED